MSNESKNSYFLKHVINFKNFMKKQEGFALIFVLVFISIIVSISADFLYQTQVGVQSSIAQRKELEAELCAQTGLQFAQFLLEVNFLMESNSSDIPAALKAQLGDNIYSKMNGISIGLKITDEPTATLEKTIAEMVPKPLLEVFEKMPGYFVLNITSESGKFNLNLLQSTYSEVASKALLRIFSGTAEYEFLQQKKITPSQLVDNLKSYIYVSTTDSTASSLMFSTEPQYTAIGAKYPPKHGPLESLKELRRVPGFHDDEVYNVFSPYFTVVPFSPIENSLDINTAPVELLALMLSSRGNWNETEIWDKFELHRREGKKFGQSDIKDWFRTNANQIANDPDSDQILQKIFGVNSSVFKVEVRGVSGNFEKTLTVFIRKVEKKKKNKAVAKANPEDPNEPQPLQSDDPFRAERLRNERLGERKIEESEDIPQESQSGISSALFSSRQEVKGAFEIISASWD